jgi:hypothetical protein
MVTSGNLNMKLTTINIAKDNMLRTKNSKKILRYLVVLGTLGKYDNSSKYNQEIRTTDIKINEAENDIVPPEYQEIAKRVMYAEIKIVIISRTLRPK